MPTRDPIDPAQVLRDFQNGVPNAELTFLSVFGPYIENVARSRCAAHGLRQPEDVEDVTQETFRLLLDPQITRYENVMSPVKSYVAGHVYNAARITAVAYRHGPSTSSTPVHVTLDNADELPAPSNGVAEAEFRLLLHDIAKGTDATSRSILSAVHAENATVVEVAARFHLTRFQVHRRLNAIYAVARSVLAA